ETLTGDKYTAKSVLLAIGRRGTPRKLHIPGEMTEKVAYRLLEPEEISGKKIVIVGGGDSAVEAALGLCEQNAVTLSYRGENFTRLKKKNAELIHTAMDNGRLVVKFNANLTSIEPDSISYKESDSQQIQKIENDLVYIFAGGELPSQFLKKIGIQITTKYGEAIMKHK
ncbi:MAG TPA: NAD(P)-binding domain-containing protein, partial [Paludibacter sp.]